MKGSNSHFGEKKRKKLKKGEIPYQSLLKIPVLVH